MLITNSVDTLQLTVAQMAEVLMEVRLKFNFNSSVD